jgi:5-methylcytosine-specific restriction endonuclease McrA
MRFSFGFLKRAYNVKCRARKYKVKGEFTRRTIETRYAEQRGKCAICQKYLCDVFEVDHSILLSKGGSNEPSNIQLLCPNCNKIKGNKC